jgi:uncharacterized membrane protein YbhN (UPF0104 family)
MKTAFFSTSNPWLSGLIQRNFFQWTKDLRIQRIALVIAGTFFTIGLVASLLAKPNLLRALSWQPLVLLLTLGVPATVALNTTEVILTAAMAGSRLPVRVSLRVAIISGAANMLPLPGGPLVRIAAVKSAGASYGESTAATFAIALIWLGTAFGYAGAWIVAKVPILGLSFLMGGVSALIAGLLTAVWLSKGWRMPLMAFTLKLALTVVDAARLWVCLSALGAVADFAQASTLAAAAVTGSAVSIVPAGLGVREGVSAVLAPFVGLSSAVGFLAVAINRLAGLTILLPITLVLAARCKLPAEEVTTAP